MSTTRDQAEKLRFWFQRNMVNENDARNRTVAQRPKPWFHFMAWTIMLVSIAVAVAGAVVYYGLFVDMKQRYARAAQVVQRTEDELNDRVVELKTEIDGLRTQTTVAEQQQAAMRKDLSELSIAHADLVGSIGMLREENASLSGVLVQTRQDLQQAESEKNELSDRLRKQTSILQRKVDYLNSVITRSPLTADRTIDPQARVLHVDRDLKFAVINRGLGEGVKKDTRYAVIRDDKQVGTVTIVEARDEVSAGDIVDGADTIQEGDMVRVP